MTVRVKYKGKPCHYCKIRFSTTKDHIVPKCRIKVPYDHKITNFVPSCVECNSKKADMRSDCECDICVKAWSTYGPIDEEIPVIQLLSM